VAENKYNKQKLNKRNKNTAKQTKRIGATLETEISLIVCFTISVNKAISLFEHNDLCLNIPHAD